MAIRKSSRQVLVHHLCDEWNNRRQQHGEVQQQVVERAKGSQGLLLAAVTAHPVTVQAHVPVREILQQFGKTTNDGVQAVSIHLVTHELDEVVHRCVDPFVHRVAALFDPAGVRHELAGISFVSCNLLHEEAVRVVPRQEDILDHVLDALLSELQRLRSDNGRIAHVHSHGVGTVEVAHVRGVRIILQALAHLLAVGCQHEAIADQVLECRLVEEVGGQHHQSVKPAPGLIQALSDEVGWESLLEVFLVLERVVLAAVGHGTTLKPAVEHLVDSLQDSLALLGGDGDVIDEMPMDVRDLPARILLKLRN
mmetsp:Transcript_171978/g.551233  ORF Transcript_171978/g.551233 Transcript_171978/m.551233 type:complete len:309 (+) Transcript_171978:1169-2095(+)